MVDSLGVRIIIWSVQKPGVFKQIGIVHSDVISSASLATAPDAQTEQKESQHNSDWNEGCQETCKIEELMWDLHTKICDISRWSISRGKKFSRRNTFY